MDRKSLAGVRGVAEMPMPGAGVWRQSTVVNAGRVTGGLFIAEQATGCINPQAAPEANTVVLMQMPVWKPEEVKHGQG